MIFDKNFFNVDSIGLNPLTEESLYGDVPMSTVPALISDWEKPFRDHHKEVLQEEINDFGFRSDNFTKNHSNKHVLFLGCSYTWGTGLYLNQIWSKILYDEINIHNEFSGYFNLGVPGDSIYTCITNAFKYFNNFGKPDVIFFNIPEIERFYVYKKDKEKFFRSILKSNKTLELLSYQYYYILEKYCEENNIKLFSFSWYLGYKIHPLDNFKTFYSMDNEKIYEYVYNSNLALKASDDTHLGPAYHKYWAEEMYRTQSIT
jgi:hypothetical protein